MPGRRYRLRLRGTYLAGGTPLANTVVGAKPAGAFDRMISLRATRPRRRGAPLKVGARSVSALSIGRLAVALPPLLPSVNQIGFDSYDLIAGTLAASRPNARGEGRVLLWVVAARRGRDGVPRPDPGGAFAFPLAGRYRDDALILEQEGVNLTFSFGRVPMRRFELRAQLDARGRALPGASFYGEVTCTDVPNYGPVLYLTGICNEQGTLAASGTFLTSRYDRRGAANRRPAGVRVSSLTLERPTTGSAGTVVARLALASGARYRARDHLVSILLVDEQTGRPLSLDYSAAITNAADARGDVSEARLALPAGTALPERLRAYVIADVFPFAVRPL